MTLLLGMIKAEGIYLSTDYRVTNSRTGALIDDASIKFLTAHYPPPDSGPKALFGYTGIAHLRDGTPVGDWLRETVRGESEVIDESMAHVRRRLDRDLAPLRAPLIINVIAVHETRRFLGAFTNVTRTRVLRKFQYVMHEVKEPTVFANGSGAARLVADQYLDTVRSQLTVRPRRAVDHMRLLATANKRVAAVERTVSPHCQVSFVSGDEAFQNDSQVFAERDQSVPFKMPMVLFGLDLSHMMEQMVRDMEAGTGPTPGFGDIERRP